MWWRKKPNTQNASQNGHCTYLGKGIDFKGHAHLDGVVRVDGQINGDLQTNDTLIIGEQAVIQGSLSGRVVISSGKITGNIIATEKVQLCKPAIILGDIASPNFSVEEGVQFHGLSSIGLEQSQGNSTKSLEYCTEESDSVFQKLGLVDNATDFPKWIPTPPAHEAS